jgi:hypothetical protein
MSDSDIVKVRLRGTVHFAIDRLIEMTRGDFESLPTLRTLDKDIFGPNRGSPELLHALNRKFGMEFSSDMVEFSDREFFIEGDA